MEELTSDANNYLQGQPLPTCFHVSFTRFCFAAHLFFLGVHFLQTNGPGRSRRVPTDIRLLGSSVGIPRLTTPSPRCSAIGVPRIPSRHEQGRHVRSLGVGVVSCVTDGKKLISRISKGTRALNVSRANRHGRDDGRVSRLDGLGSLHLV